ncbi:hypothetical protein I7I52_08805 [Histoplasma capsulatum]|uniref:Uncharacterized protein n=1 Tax=Ajellomyces capsulatus TaxID=5037 RepID=A0A8H8D3R6_AJECA|nr:hypothetical protein I7I52_08805 [Histoplasma capsulatum]
MDLTPWVIIYYTAHCQGTVTPDNSAVTSGARELGPFFFFCLSSAKNVNPVRGTDCRRL